MAADSRGGRSHRRDAHVRDVLLALGGSADETDLTDDKTQDASLASRIESYTRLVSQRSTPVPRPAPLPRAPRRRPAVGRHVRRLVAAVVGAVLAVAGIFPRAGHALSHWVRSATRTVAQPLRRAALGGVRFAGHALRLIGASLLSMLTAMAVGSSSYTRRLVWESHSLAKLPAARFTRVEPANQIRSWSWAIQVFARNVRRPLSGGVGEFAVSVVLAVVLGWIVVRLTTP
jgi:hypothetical protein